MKKLLLTVFSLLLVVGLTTAQDGKKQLKAAEKAISKYNDDPVANAGSLSEGFELLEQAFGDEKINSEAKNFNKKGEIFQELVNNQIKLNLLNPEAKIANPTAGVNAFKAYSKALEIAEKKGDIKTALKGINEVEGDLNNIGVSMYTEKNYEAAFENFVAGINAFKLLQANEKESRLDDAALYTDHVFFTGVCAYYSEDNSRAKPFFQELFDAGSDQALVYEGLYKLNYDTDKDKAIGYLTAGREKFPDDTGMLFAEINHYLSEGQMDILIEKLNAAEAKEPDNLSVVVTRGKVFDELHTKARAEGDEATADDYFNKAMADYNKVVGLDAKNFDAVYSIGALYYNKAAGMAEEINKLATDYSKEGTKKYNDKKVEMDAVFGEALPFFVKAEELDATDVNTMIALKEIYARQSNFEKSNIYKEKIEAAQE